MSEIPERPSEEVQKAAVRLGYVGLVAHRTTIQEAYDYATEFAKSDDSSLIPVHVIMNTMALQWAQERLNTLEMMDAIISYCEQDSRSTRRKNAIIGGAKVVHKQLTGEDYDHVPE